MKRESVINIIIFVISCVILVYFVFSYQRKNEELKVKSNNIETLLGEIERYKAQDSSNVVEIGILYMTIDELERYRNELIEDVEMLQIRNKDLESLLRATSESNVGYVTTLRDTIYNNDTIRIYEYRDSYTSVSGRVQGDTISGDIAIYDTLTIVKHIEKKKFLCIRYGIKDVRVSVKNTNPNVKINDIEVIEIIK
jgi:type II secretory pathway pseudopilin PulG